MFTEKEVAEFVALLCAFAIATELSDRQLAMLFGVPHITMNRWHQLPQRSEGLKKPLTVTRYLADPIRLKIEYLNELHATTGLYVAINREPPVVRTAALRRELDKRAV